MVDDSVRLYPGKKLEVKVLFSLSLDINILRRKTGAVPAPPDISSTDCPRRFHRIDKTGPTKYLPTDSI